MVQFVKQSVEALGIAPADEKSALLMIEKAGRTAYKSEERITEGSALKFVSHLKSVGHLSVLEHSNIVLQLSRGIAGEAFIYGTFKKRAAYHAIWPLEDRSTFIAGNIRAWLETLDKLNAAARWASKALYYAIAPKLNEYFPALFQAVEVPVDFQWVSRKVDLCNEADQIRFLKTHGESDLPAFVFRITTDRGITHEIVRHRVLSFTQESTRYVNYGNRGVTLILPEEYDYGISATLKDADAAYGNMLYHGLRPQIARDVLPNLLKAEIVVSGRWSGWKHFIELRDSSGAHPRIQKIARAIREYFEELGLTI